MSAWRWRCLSNCHGEHIDIESAPTSAMSVAPKISHKCGRQREHGRAVRWDMCVLCWIQNNNNNQSTAVATHRRHKCLLKFRRFCLAAQFFFFFAVALAAAAWFLSIGNQFFSSLFSNFVFFVSTRRQHSFVRRRKASSWCRMCVVHRRVNPHIDNCLLEHEVEALVKPKLHSDSKPRTPPQMLPADV